ncbi:hypothetical protein PLICRDRAFT_171561 [Plicaturopsis crispa FD-325 SS-3]|nr:hypothetical protein PLICRDRAFT_171561 [Plicaturopsis crispa FD-325 SS-3]
MVRTSRSPMRSFLLCLCCVFSLLFVSVHAQSSSQTASATSSSQSVSLVLTTSSVLTTSVSRSGNRAATVTTAVPTVFNATVTPTPTSSASASSSASATAAPIVLETKLDPGFGVLGAILIITGLPSAFWGHKNRWTSFFLIGFYTLSLVCIVLILKFGVLTAVNLPSETLRGLFVLASVVAGIAGGAITIFFWKSTKYFIGAWGGFAFALWIQCFRDGGLIRTIGLRWIMYMALALVGFVMCTIPKIHYHVLLVSTAFVGASSFMLGIDCFTTAGLKEFYIWNIGFTALFPKYTNNGIQFPVSQVIEIELGLLGAVALAGVAVQLRVLSVLQRKLQEIQQEQKKRDAEAEVDAAEAFAGVLREREQWEREHPTLGMHDRTHSGYSNTPLLKGDYADSPLSTPGLHDEKQSMTMVNGDGRQRTRSGVSDFFAAPAPEDDRRASRSAGGALPPLNLGLGITEDVPRSFIAEDTNKKPTEQSKEDLLLEIQNIRKSIDALKSDTASISSGTHSRLPSFSSKRTLSQDLSTIMKPAHLRPPRETDPRARVHSMELNALTHSTPPMGASIGRPISAPLRDDNWDEYIRDRKLLQPPSGVTPPIGTSPSPIGVADRVPVPQAVAEALANRKRRESALELGELGRARTSSPMRIDTENVQLADLTAKTRKAHASHHSPAQNHSPVNNNPSPVNILPPRRPGAQIAAPVPQRPSHTRTRTFEELAERHREKMRDLQAPVTQAERENAELEAAKARWERSKAAEKQAVAKRQADKAALLAKEEKKRKPDEARGRTSPAIDGKTVQRRSLSVDKLGAQPSSKRMSTMKVEDWQREQQAPRSRAPASGPQRDSRIFKPDRPTVPFPDNGRPPHDRRRSGVSAFQDPPS